MNIYIFFFGGSRRPVGGGPPLAPACLLLAARGRRYASPVTGPFSKGRGVSQIRLGTTQFCSEPTQSPLVAPSSGCAYLYVGLRCRPRPPSEWDDILESMKRTSAFIPILLVASACGGSSNTTAPTATVQPSVSSETSPTATVQPSVSSETFSSELDQLFAVAVRDFVASEWGGWSDGAILGECLASNASAVSAPAKQGVIDYGLEKVYDNISQYDGSSLSAVWDDCETVTPSSEAAVVVDAVENRPGVPTFVPSTSFNPFPDGVEAAFESAVDTEFLTANEKAGISVAVFTNGSLWTYASGIASSIAEMTPNTPLLIRSTSKTFLSALILDQAERGLFELGSSLESVLSDHPHYPSLDTTTFNPSVSIAEMLSMRSGLPPRDPLAAGGSDVFSNIDWRPVDILKLANGPWVEPGEFEYSDTNSVLLGLVAEQHGDNALNVIYQDTFFDPLGITAGLGPQDGFPLNTARPYGDLTLLAEQRNLDINGFGDEIEASDDLADPRDWYTGSTRLGWASAGMFTTAENMARWAYELYSHNGRALSPPNRTRLLNSVNAELVNFENRMQRYGYYVTESEVVLEDQRVVTVYGHPGGGTNFISKLAYSPELDLAVSVLTNSPMKYAGSCPDHSAEKSQRLTPQLCIVQELFAAHAETTATSTIDLPTTATNLVQDDTHSRMSLRVPYMSSDPISDLVPMGEKIHHNNPDGHVGIDFQWRDHSGGPPTIVASATGTVLSVELDPYSNNTSLIIQVLHQVGDERYYTAYEGLRIDSSLQPGDLVNQGQILGEAWDDPDTGDDVYMIHWEFGLCPGNGFSPCAPPKRLCPMSYFGEESRSMLEEVWSGSKNQYKIQYPHICSGAFYGRSGGNTPYQTPDSTESASTELDGSEETGSTSSVEDLKQFTAECSFNEDLVEISCTAVGYPSDSVLRWESTASWASNNGPFWNFVVHPELLESSAEVTVKECQGTDCSSLSVLVDTSAALGN